MAGLTKVAGGLAKKTLNKGKENKGEEKKSSLGGVSDEKRAQEAEKSGMEKILQSPKKMAMKIVKIIIALIVKFLTIILIKLLPFIILFIVISSLFGWLIDDDDSSSSTYVASAAGTVNSTTNTTETSLSEEQTTSFIDNIETDNEDLKTELKDKSSEIQKWQEDYGYDASVLIALAFNEAEGVSDFNLDDFMAEMNEIAENWKKEGLTTIEEIIEQYVYEKEGIDPENTNTANVLLARTTINSIVNNISKAKTDAGITGEQQKSGDGYDSTYINKYGREFRQYMQNHPNSSYSNLLFGDQTSTIGQEGCSLISMAIALSGFEDTEIDIVSFSEHCSNNKNGYNPKYFSSYSGLKNTYDSSEKCRATEVQDIKNTLIKNITQNSVITVEMKGKETGGTGTFTQGHYHWVVLLDYDEEKDQFYVSNPWYYSSAKGWIDSDIVVKDYSEHYIVRMISSTSTTTKPTVASTITRGYIAEILQKEDKIDSINVNNLSGDYSFIAISSKGNYLKYNTDKVYRYMSTIKLPYIYYKAATNPNLKTEFYNNTKVTFVDEKFNNGESRTITIEETIGQTLKVSSNGAYETLCTRYKGTDNNASAISWLGGVCTSGSAVWGEGNVGHQIYWMYSILANELGVEEPLYSDIMNIASQCSGGMTARDGYTIYNKTGSGYSNAEQTLGYYHDVGIVKNNDTNEYYIYAIMTNSPSANTRYNITESIFNIFKSQGI